MPSTPSLASAGLPPKVHADAARRRRSLVLPAAGVALFVALWAAAVAVSGTRLVPGPWAVVRALGELLAHGLLVRYLVASLFRVTWGFLLAAALAIPLGMALGLSRRGEAAWNPLVQVLRPISPLAWIPISILWFGVGDGAAVWLIFVASFFSLLVTVIRAVHDVADGRDRRHGQGHPLRAVRRRPLRRGRAGRAGVGLPARDGDRSLTFRARAAEVTARSRR